ncbi:Protein kinase domain [Legionella steigerwaltii]|uniref:Protein kinase domain n=1 Tax=Legionella steigerwaltii TaxID=460 RepID=A0A378LDE2_9GAMM|nr:hypothetical protein [Legionella steigerwaltii]KTD71635.1 Protein kinase domain protein [Legionella steigerwaltii]STY23789.1 Protein kinase domain [Legionella steigerwaltii]
MTNKGKDKKSSSLTLFPVKQHDGTVVYYASDFSQELGNSVYKGHQCALIQNEPIDLKPRRIKKEELVIDENRPVSIKLYDDKQHPSPFQFYASQKAVLTIEGRDVLIMDFIDGFHIYPDSSDNPELNQLTFLQAVDVSWQLILRLNHLHYNNTSSPPIVHGDIHGENVKIKINVIDDARGKKYRIEVAYLDLDYAKRIIDVPQIPQGTPEHIAIEILKGDYSESSDFFALAPLLLSIFGAKNPLKKIIEFRNKNPHMKPNELIRAFRDLGFCSDGLFDHFEKKPDHFICELIKKFILQMGEKNKKNRPSPNAILEFFTALRQLILLDECDEFTADDKAHYVLRLCVAAKEEHWLIEKKYQSLFFSLDEHLQNRLITLMGPSQCVLLYKIAQEKSAPASLVDQLRKSIAVHLKEHIRSLEIPSWPSLLFFSSITQHDIQWLLDCYEHNNATVFYSAKHETTRKKLERCTEKNLAPLISIVTEGITKYTDASSLPVISCTN